MAVLAARGHELKEHFPYGIVRQLVERAVEGKAGGVCSPAPRSWRVSCARGGSLSRVRRTPGAALGHLHGLYWLTVNLSQRAPLLITVDDAQLAEAPRCGSCST